VFIPILADVPRKPRFNLANLISYWKLEEAANGTRNDSFGTNHLTDVHTNVAQGTGKLGNCASFAALASADDLNRVSNASLQMGGTSWTWNCWINPTDLAGTYELINKTSGAPRELEIQLNGANGRIDVAASSDGVNYDSFVSSANSSISAGVWTMVTVQFDGANLGVAVNAGMPVTSPSSGVASQTADLNMGFNARSGGKYKGLLDEVLFAKRAYSAIELATLYNGGAGKQPF
jgi:hypothetical protein